MNKGFLMVLLAVLLTLTLTLTFTMPVFSQDYDIRKLRWGMSFEAVKAAENLGDDFFKQEELLGIMVEINFGFDYKGLYSVIYSTREKEFAVKAGEVMKKKYGEPKKGLDYAFIMQSKIILKQYPKEVLAFYEKGDAMLLNSVSSRDERKLIRNALAKQDIWQYGNSTALLLYTQDVAKLSYWSQAHFAASKKKFDGLLAELKSRIKQAPKKKADDTEKF